MTQNSIAVRRQMVCDAIALACERSGRSPSDVALVAVSKTMPPERVREAYHAGQRLFGENRVQEAVEKMEALQSDIGPDLTWHLIGHLQSNKVKPAVQHFALIESVDSVRLAKRLDRQAEAEGRRLPILLEVNVAGEDTKSGFAVDEPQNEIPELLRLDHIDLRGLMTVAPLVSDPEAVRPVFRRLRQLREQLSVRFELAGFTQLSMGMSGDFEVAIEEGATIVRVGRALFGERT